MDIHKGPLFIPIKLRSDTMSKKDEIKKLISSYNRRLQKLKEQAAISGLSTEPKVLIEIEDIEAKIKNLKADLEALNDSDDGEEIQRGPKTTKLRIQTASLDSLILQLLAHNNRYPDYMVWLGAGASVSSGIPTAFGIVSNLLRRVYAQRNRLTIEETSNISDDEIRRWSISSLDWFDPDNRNRSEYAQGMENVYHAPGIRERYLKSIMQDARPSEGYKYLGMLLFKNVFDTIITTNFDQLVRQITDRLLPLPLVEVNALEQYPTLAPYPEEPRIIRMHGDFWHGNVLNTEGELEKTPTIRYKAVIDLLRSYGLIVIGYSGVDRGIMRNLFERLIQDHNIGRKGIYWCHRKGDPLSSQVERLLERAPYAYLVEIDSFDTVFERIATEFKLKLPPEWGLQQKLDTVQGELEIFWDWLALITDLIDTTSTELTSLQLQKNLKRLANILRSSKAILFYVDPNASTYYIPATVDVTLNLGTVQLSNALQNKITEDQRDYISFNRDEATINDPIFQDFADDYIIEVFTIWQNDQLIGFIVFNSAQSVLDHTQIRLVRSAVQLLVVQQTKLAG